MFKQEIIQKGDASGNGLIVKFRLPSGLEIVGLPTKNFYGGHWDLGPTWNYVVLADKPFLVDSGRYGQGRNLIDMMVVAGINPADLDFVLISHSHEDHDGGLAELIELTDLTVKAHTVYDLLIRRYSGSAPQGRKQDYPAKCWHCFMPESFIKDNCLKYHTVLQSLNVDTIGDTPEQIGPGITTMHVPGHSPDCLAVQLGAEALVVGDVILPDITPWPTRLELYDEVAEILRSAYPNPGTIFGLMRYLDSLKQIRQTAELNPDILVLPGHRLYYQDHWNPIHLESRIQELLNHHIQRSTAILEIVASEPKHPEEIARLHFKPSLLKGPGKMMAANEIISHCELMLASDDLREVKHHQYLATGSSNFEALIQSDQVAN